MTNIMPPLTGTPLDYVPIDAVVTKRSALHEPTRFRAPTLRRALIAGAAMSGAVAALMFIPVATIAIILMIGAVRGGDWAASRLNSREERHEQDY